MIILQAFSLFSNPQNLREPHEKPFIFDLFPDHESFADLFKKDGKFN